MTSAGRGSTPDPVLPRAHEGPGPRVTAIGGGHGLARTLTAMAQLGWSPTAVVSVADDGGSSGRLRRDYGGIPPGDLRRALSTLVRDPVSRRLLEHRFDTGDLAGHALGNLVLLAAADFHGGDVSRGLEVLSGLFGSRGTVLPAALDPTDLTAELADGTLVRGQKAITRTPGVRRVRIEPDSVANPAAVDAVASADLVVIGPGSLFTSLLPPLLLGGLADALQGAGTTALVANLREQPGETTGLDLPTHLDILFDHLPERLDLDVLVANSAPHRGVAPALEAPREHPRVGRMVTAPLVDPDGGHDPVALSRVLAGLAPAAGTRSEPPGTG